jgi:lactate 2-monooxygenase
LSGRLPSFPTRFDELEAKAHAAMPAGLVSYVAGGCGDERTQEANVEAFDKWGLMPRMFVGAKHCDMSIEFFDMRLPSPLFMSPIGVIGLCAQDGHCDLATARAAALTGAPMVASTRSVDPLEAVAAGFKTTPRIRPALHPNRSRAGGEPCRVGRACRLQGNRGDARPMGDRLAPA